MAPVVTAGGQAPFGPIGVMRSWLRPAAGAAGRRRGLGAPWAWIVFVLGALYFILPLVGIFFHSIRTRPDIFLAYRQVIADPGALNEVIRRQAPGTWLPLVVRRDGRFVDLVAEF